MNFKREYDVCKRFNDLLAFQGTRRYQHEATIPIAKKIPSRVNYILIRSVLPKSNVATRCMATCPIHHIKHISLMIGPRYGEHGRLRRGDGGCAVWQGAPTLVMNIIHYIVQVFLHVEPIGSKWRCKILSYLESAKACNITWGSEERVLFYWDTNGVPCRKKKKENRAGTPLALGYRNLENFTNAL